MNSFVLKIVGIVTMLLDHIGKLFFPEVMWLQYFGRLAFPIFAFQIAQGYLHTKDFGRYLKRLLIMAVISQAPYSVFMMMCAGEYVFRLNVLFTLALGLVAIFIMDRVSSVVGRVGLLVLVAGLAEVCQVDYGAYGVVTILLFYFWGLSIGKLRGCAERGAEIRCLVGVLFVLITLGNYSGIRSGIFVLNAEVLLMTGSASAVLVLLQLYNGKLGPKCKYLFYVFYPTHLIILAVVKFLVE